MRKLLPYLTIAFPLACAPLAGCTPAQIQVLQADQARVQAVIVGVCTNSVLEAVIASAAPGVPVCLGGVVSADAITFLINNPAVVAKLESMKH